MKRIIALVLAMLLALSALGALAASKSVKIDKKNFPDRNFREQISLNCDFNGDGKLSASEIKKNGDVNVTDCNIGDVTGIQLLTNLKYIIVNGNRIKTLDVSHNTKLQMFVCCYNRLKKINLGRQKYLHYLDCSANINLKKLDIGKCPKLLKLFREGKKSAKGDYVLWKIGSDRNKNYLKIPKTCNLYDGSKLLYKGR